MGDVKRISISAESGKRIASVVRHVERQPRGGAPGERAQANSQIIPLRIAKCGSGGIAAATSITAPSSGDVTLYDWSTGGDPAAGDDDTAYNFATGDFGAIAADKTLIVGWMSGRWVVLWEACDAP